MNLSGGIFRPGMRGYFIPLVAGLVLVAAVSKVTARGTRASPASNRPPGY